MKLSDKDVKSLADAWKFFEANALKRVPERERGAMRTAFYAGAAYMMDLFLEATEPDDEAVCCANLDALRAEINGFAGELAAKIPTKGRS